MRGGGVPSPKSDEFGHGTQGAKLCRYVSYSSPVVDLRHIRDPSRNRARHKDGAGEISGIVTVFKTRSRMISIRLSDDEYIGLKRLCVSTGARSVSDLARTAMSDLLADGLEARIGTRVEEVRLQISALDKKLDEISARLSSLEV